MTRTALLVAAISLLAASSAVAGDAPEASKVYGADCMQVTSLPSDVPALHGFSHTARADRFCKANGSSMAVSWGAAAGADYYTVRTYAWNGTTWKRADTYETTGRAADLWFEGKAKYYALALTGHDASGDPGHVGGMIVVEVQSDLSRPSERAAVDALQHFVKRLQDENRALRAELREATGGSSAAVAVK